MVIGIHTFPLPLHSFLSDNIDLLISSQRALLKKAPLSRIVTLAPNALSDGTKEMLECYRLAEEKYSKYVYILVHVQYVCCKCTISCILRFLVFA